MQSAKTTGCAVRFSPWALLCVPPVCLLFACLLATGAGAHTSRSAVRAAPAAATAAGCLSLGAGQVTAFDSTATVKPTDATCGFTAADVTAAQNEFESVQVVIRAPAGAALSNVNVTLTECFSWCNGNQQATDDAIRIYREEYTTVFRRSDLESTPDPAASLVNPNGAGERWPDALLPVKDYLYNEARTGAWPVASIPAGENRVAWIDVLVPKGQAPGSYTAKLSVTGGGSTQIIPINLTVLGFGVPSTPTFQTIVGLSNKDGYLCGVLHPDHSACDAWQLAGVFSRLALENRVQWLYAAPDAVGKPVDPARKAAFDTYLKPYYTGKGPYPATPGKPRLADARMPVLGIYGWCANDLQCAGGLAELQAHEDWQGNPPRFTLYCEELFQNAGNWNDCHDWWTAAKAAGVQSLQTIAVADVESLDWATTHTGWGSAFSDVTTLLPIVQWLNNGHAKDVPVDFPGNVTDVRYGQFLAQGGTRQLWTYTSCVSLGCSCNPGQQGCDTGAGDGVDDYSESDDLIDDPGRGKKISPFRGWPSEVIDQPATEQRALSWLAFRWGVVNGGNPVTGQQYFDATNRFGEAWNTCSNPSAFKDDQHCLFSEGGNGDGTLLYPGTVARIGGADPIPLESIRLKRIRDGNEDYDWLKWLADHDATSKAFAASEAAKLFPHAFCTESPAPTVLLPQEQGLCSQTATLPGVRGELAAKIASLLGGQAADLSVTATAPATAPVGDDFTVDLAVKNAGPQAAANVQLTDALPAGLVAETATPGAGSCTVNGQQIVCSLGTIAAGATVHITATLAGTALGARVQTVGVTTTTTDSNVGNNSVSPKPATTLFGPAACTIVGTAAGETLNGTGGNDVICALRGVDVVHGNGGNDVLYGGSGADQLFGDGGNDALVGGRGPDADSIDGGIGVDSVNVFDAAAGATINLHGQPPETYDGDGPGDANIGVDGLTSIESGDGSPFGDSLIGDDGPNVLNGGSGDDDFDALEGSDVLRGGPGNDTISGQGGSDTFYGGPGNDTLSGGLGSDTVSYTDASGNVTVNLGTTAAQNTSGGGVDTLLDAFENLTGSGYNDTLTGNGLANVISAAGGNDTVNAGNGNDSVNGGPGNDIMNGGADVDAVVYAGAAAVTVDLGTVAAQGTGGAGTDTISAFENLTGSNYDDTLTGNTGGNVLTGGLGNDTIKGLAGADSLKGGDGTDTLNGVDGVQRNDRLDGGAANDNCTADAGDVLVSCP